MRFTNKAIIIVSQQSWGTMFISKHHYAIELARLGNDVYFLDGPDQSGSLRPGQINIESTSFERLFVIRHRLFYPYIIKFKAKKLHRLLIKRHIRNVFKKIGRTKVDVVWSFDISDTIPLSAFEADLKIFMPVDEPDMSTVATSALGAKAIFSVTKEILEKYKNSGVPGFFINHGVTEKFIQHHINNEYRTPLNVGLSGNFLRPDIDWYTLETIINAHPGIQFNFWGAYQQGGNLLITTAGKHIEYISRVSRLENVTFHGAVNSDVLAEELQKMDAFLICYDIDKDQSGATNYHKVLEYLATGKVVVANNITTYAGSDLLIMPKERNNKRLPELFAEVMENISQYNSVAARQLRIDYAKQYTYSQNIKKIETLLTNL